MCCDTLLLLSSFAWKKPRTGVVSYRCFTSLLFYFLLLTYIIMLHSRWRHGDLMTLPKVMSANMYLLKQMKHIMSQKRYQPFRIRESCCSITLLWRTLFIRSVSAKYQPLRQTCLFVILPSLEHTNVCLKQPSSYSSGLRKALYTLLPNRLSNWTPLWQYKEIPYNSFPPNQLSLKQYANPLTHAIPAVNCCLNFVY